MSLILAILIGCGGDKAGDTATTPITSTGTRTSTGSTTQGAQLLTFEADTDGGPVGTQVAFTWTVDDPGGLGPSCEFDAEGDGVVDEVVADCTAQLSLDWTYPAEGSFTPTLTLVGGNTLSVDLAICGDPQVLIDWVTASETWPDVYTPMSCVDYTIPGQIRVAAGEMLTIDEGVVIEADADASIWVLGGLMTLGVPDRPVILRGSTPVRGHWGGLAMENDLWSMLIGAEIRHAGSLEFNFENIYAGISVSRAAAPVDITDSIVAENAGVGVFNDTSEVVIDGSVITDNEAPLWVTDESAWGAWNTSTYAGNDDDAIRVRPGDIYDPTTWQALDVPYRVFQRVTLGAMRVHADWTLDPGVEIEVGADTALLVEATGSLTAIGTATDPIVIRGEDPAPGSWRGIRLDGAGHVLEHVEIAHGGGDEDNLANQPGSLELERSTEVELRSVTIRDGGAYGLVLSTDATLPVMDDVTLVGHSTAPAWTTEDAASQLVSGTNSYVGNAYDSVYVASQIPLDGSHTWEDLGVPWYVHPGNLRVEGTLTVDPGTVIELDELSMIEVPDGATLDLLGTSTDPIVLQPVPGAPKWRGIYFLDGSGTLQHTQIVDGYDQHTYIDGEGAVSIATFLTNDGVGPMVTLGDGMSQTGAPYGIAFGPGLDMNVSGPGCITMGALFYTGGTNPGQCSP